MGDGKGDAGIGILRLGDRQEAKCKLRRRWGGAIRAVYSFAVQYPNGQIQEMLLGTERNNNGVGRKIYLVGNQYVLQPAECASYGYVPELFAW
jgi:hypothetical protein